MTPCLEAPEADDPTKAEDGVGEDVAQEDVGDTEEPDGGAWCQRQSQPSYHNYPPVNVFCLSAIECLNIQANVSQYYQLCICLPDLS